jgi:outer membrane protein
LEELSKWLIPDYDPDRDFIPEPTEEEMERMSMGRQTPARPANEESSRSTF